MSDPVPMPTECGGLDIPEVLGRLPGGVAELLQTAAGQRLAELDRAVATGQALEAMEAAQSLASLVGVLPIPALGVHIRNVYSAASKGDLAAMAQAHEHLAAVLRWVLGALGKGKA
ncbi:MAG: hypothetical protein HY916_02790 [Desulfovibrio sp.]|nr:hypothetical protein [Desulfovibrio sp.]